MSLAGPPLPWLCDQDQAPLTVLIDARSKQGLSGHDRAATPSVSGIPGPEAARDVGQAMAKNPVALLIPCHRVLAAGGKIGGFSAPGGSAAKIRMLALEGVDLEPPRPAQQSLGF
jgi:O-6-methylguanine DNA methyltransferase